MMQFDDTFGERGDGKIEQQLVGSLTACAIMCGNMAEMLNDAAEAASPRLRTMLMAYALILSCMGNQKHAHRVMRLAAVAIRLTGDKDLMSLASTLDANHDSIKEFMKNMGEDI